MQASAPNIIDDNDEFEKSITDKQCSLTLRKQKATGFGCDTIDTFKFKPEGKSFISSNTCIEYYMKKFKFSHSGNFFAISTSLDCDVLQLYDCSTDIEKLLSDRVANKKYVSEISNVEIKEAIKI